MGRTKVNIYSYGKMTLVGQINSRVVIRFFLTFSFHCPISAAQPAKCACVEAMEVLEGKFNII